MLTSILLQADPLEAYEKQGEAIGEVFGYIIGAVILYYIFKAIGKIFKD